MIASIIVWIGSIIGIITIFALQSNKPTTFTDNQLLLILLDILIGVISWLIFVGILSKKIHERFTGLKASSLSIISLLLTLVGGAGLIIFMILQISSINQPQSTVKVASYKLIKPGMSLGSSGEEVKIIQSALQQDKDIYPSGTVSGYYGVLTREAVINFQRKFNLDQTGEINESTANKFNELYGLHPREYYLNFQSVAQQNNIKENNQQINTSIIINDPDPTVPCNFPHSGSRMMKRSACTNMTDCQVGQDWYPLTVDECRLIQEAQYNSNKAYLDSLVNKAKQDAQDTIQAVQNGNNSMLDSARQFQQYLNTINNNLQTIPYPSYIAPTPLVIPPSKICTPYLDKVLPGKMYTVEGYGTSTVYCYYN